MGEKGTTLKAIYLDLCLMRSWDQGQRDRKPSYKSCHLTDTEAAAGIGGAHARKPSVIYLHWDNSGGIRKLRRFINSLWHHKGSSLTIGRQVRLDARKEGKKVLSNFCEEFSYIWNWWQKRWNRWKKGDWEESRFPPIP